MPRPLKAVRLPLTVLFAVSEWHLKDAEGYTIASGRDSADGETMRTIAHRANLAQVTPTFHEHNQLREEHGLLLCWASIAKLRGIAAADREMLENLGWRVPHQPHSGADQYLHGTETCTGSTLGDGSRRKT